jgi:nitroreductase
MDLMKTLLNRRSVRAYTGELISEENMKKILCAGLLSPTGRNRKPWEFVVVQDKDVLAKMAGSRIAGAGMLSGAAAAIVVLGDEEQTDVWTEDCSIAMSNMHLMASALGVGSCWIQGRDREAIDGETTEDFLRRILQFPAECRLEAILSLGMPDEELPGRAPESLPFNKVHINKY